MIEPIYLPSEPSFVLDTPQLPVRMVLGDLDQPLAEMTPWQVATPDHGAPVVLDVEQRSSLSALLSQLPAVVQSAHGALATTYRLTFAPDVMQKMSDVMHAVGGGIRAPPSMPTSRSSARAFYIPNTDTRSDS